MATKITDARRAQAEAQIRELQREIKFDIRDFTVDYLVEKFRKALFFIPPYQREYIWAEANKCNFIESIILGLPIPMMFVAELDDGTLEIVDGAQRIQTLVAFLGGDLCLKKLMKLPTLNDFGYNDLSSSQQKKIGNKALRIVVLDSTTTPELRHEIFKRVNTSGEKARPSEIRRGSYPGPLMDFINKCAKNDLFLELCPISDSLLNRREAQELILRFFAYSDEYKLFKHDVGKFLDSFIIGRQTQFDSGRYEDEFLRMLKFVKTHFPHGFAKSAKSKITPRVRFEAIAVGVNLALRQDPDLAPHSVSWIDSDEFKKQTTTHASNSSTRLQGRIDFVKNHLLNG